MVCCLRYAREIICQLVEEFINQFLKYGLKLHYTYNMCNNWRD